VVIIYTDNSKTSHYLI